jgi:hypothetical protein
MGHSHFKVTSLKNLTIQENNEFMELFSGNTDSYGKHLPFADNENEVKKKGKNLTIKQKVTLKDYSKHLLGIEGLGIIPLNKDNNVKFIAIDIDNYNKELIKKIVIKNYFNQLPFVPFRSKSGGLHLYIFFDKFYEYKPIYEITKQFIPVLGLDNNVEIFPKQITIKKGRSGNWINLPYFNHTETKQYLINENNEETTLTEALLLIKEKVLTFDQYKNSMNNFALMDAPPCLQRLYYEREIELRNEYLFNLATYLKNKNEETFDTEIFDYNEFLIDPLDPKEIERTIISSHKKKDYTYKCKTPPIQDVCIRDLCKKRRYGIEGEDISKLSFEEFIQHRTDPPYYEWIINGISFTFFNETDIINQQKFRELCFRKLNILPFRLKENKWVEIVNRALANIIVKGVEADEDISPGSIFMNHLYEYLEHRVHAENYSQVLIDRVYKDEKTRTYIFRGKDFVNYLFYQKNFRYFKVLEIQDRLKKLNALPERLYIDKNNRSTRVWRLPFRSIATYMTDPKEGLAVDFTKLGVKNDESEY